MPNENIAGSNWASDWDEVLLKHPASGLLIGLLQHPANPGEPFSEFRTGLDHPATVAHGPVGPP